MPINPLQKCLYADPDTLLSLEISAEICIVVCVKRTYLFQIWLFGFLCPFFAIVHA